jgi:hypothetical protein
MLAAVRDVGSTLGSWPPCRPSWTPSSDPNLVLPALENDKLETEEDRVNWEEEPLAGVTRQHRRLDEGGVAKTVLVVAALLEAFLANVSTKFDLTDRATDDRVARSQRTHSLPEGKPVGAAVSGKRSALRCSIVVVVVFYGFGAPHPGVGSCRRQLRILIFQYC